MPVVKISINGIEGIQAALEELPRSVQASVLRRVAKQALQPVAAAMRSGAPVGKGASKRGKRYRDTIGVSGKLSPKQRGYAKAESEYRINAYAGAGSGLSHLIEKGTQPRRTKSGANRGSVGARPHIVPAWATHADALPQRIGKLLWAEIAKTAQRLASKASK